MADTEAAPAPAPAEEVIIDEKAIADALASLTVAKKKAKAKKPVGAFEAVEFATLFPQLAPSLCLHRCYFLDCSTRERGRIGRTHLQRGAQSLAAALLDHSCCFACFPPPAGFQNNFINIMVI